MKFPTCSIYNRVSQLVCGLHIVFLVLLTFFLTWMTCFVTEYTLNIINVLGQIKITPLTTRQYYVYVPLKRYIATARPYSQRWLNNKRLASNQFASSRTRHLVLALTEKFVKLNVMTLSVLLNSYTKLSLIHWPNSKSPLRESTGYLSQDFNRSVSS